MNLDFGARSDEQNLGDMPVPRSLLPLALPLAVQALACTRYAGPAPVPGPFTPGKAAVSCPVAPPRKEPVKLTEVSWYGRAGDRTWVLGKEDGHLSLARLVDGHLVSLRLPGAFDDAIVSVHAQEQFLWILRTDPGLPSRDPAWLLVDTSDPKDPSVGKLESLAPLPEAGPHEFGVFEDRALFFMGPKRDFVFWDLTSRKVLGKAAHSEAQTFEKPTIRCEKTGCFAVVVEGDGPSRRMAVRRFDRDGNETREELGPGHVAEHTTIDAGPKTIAVWSRFDAKGLWSRFIDAATGKPSEQPFTMSGVEQDLQDPQVITSREGPILAWQAARVGWRLGKLAENGRGVEFVTTIPGEGSFLTAAAADDGIVTAVFSTGTDEDGSKHEWYATARASFVMPSQTEKPAELVTLLDDAHGSGRGGYAAHAMAAPGYGAALVTPQGETSGESFVMFLREPCGAK